MQNLAITCLNRSMRVFVATAMSLKALCLIFSLLFAIDVVLAADETRSRSDELGPCHACKIFVESFEKGVHRTAPIFETRSQQQLTEILQGVCKEPRTKTKCLETAGAARSHVEQWWLQSDPAEFFQYVCIDKLEVCCPKQHYGRQCLPCPGGGAGGAVCGGRGRCRGAGTRRGNGTCDCDSGHRGDTCEHCVPGYYKASEEPGAECERCHYSCAGGCRGGTPLDCVACRPGFTLEDGGCHDINECDDVHVCAKNEFCLNGAGSYKCMACDRACKGCYGDSPDMCRKCAKGYMKKGEICVKEREDEEMDQMTTTRYMTYLGLLVAGGVLYPRAPALAAGVGALTLSYIALAEYYCRVSGHASLLDLPLYNIY